jgi:FkbM family methyltransferase
MNWRSAFKRIEPIGQKLAGKLPLCPWASVLPKLDPRTLSAYPPTMKISIVDEDDHFRKLRFNDVHDAWFPKNTPLNAELWNEYLGVFWPHRANAHYYLAGGTDIVPGDICLDCGACEGFFAFQALAAGAAKVVCIEPSEEMAECLNRTFADEIRNGRVVVRHVAVGAMDGTASFAFDSLQPFSGKLESATTSITIPVTTIARLFQDLKLPCLNFIKMDIEGAEIQAMEGAMSLLAKQHPKLAITTYHRPFDFMALQALATAAGYRKIKPAGLAQWRGGIYRPVMLHARK